MKKRVPLIICIFSLLLIGVISYGIHFNQLKKEADEKKELENLYYKQNIAFRLCSNMDIINYYHGIDDSDINYVVISIYTYNIVCPQNKLPIDEFIAYISEEYDSEGTPRIYSQPPNIKGYIDWFWTIGQGEDTIQKYKKYFIHFLAKKSRPPFWEMSYEELISNLEEFQKDPEYNPFLEG
ncbi:hypothetical protein [Butyrivibrio sp. LB2008]|uniref:hypothetical protein n=1 Tax=Butyrivibrio sp. LB2008 TaxID=1408305 RepID=UPI000478F92A|nr:hypothetical protein [Butyrivibrio sp. LB2008]